MKSAHVYKLNEALKIMRISADVDGDICGCEANTRGCGCGYQKQVQLSNYYWTENSNNTWWKNFLSEPCLQLVLKMRDLV